MTAEPRDELHRLVEEIVMAPGWREALRAAVATADRENAELRGQLRESDSRFRTAAELLGERTSQLAAAQAQLAEVRAVLFRVRRGTSGRKIIERDEEAEIVAALSAAPQPEPDDVIEARFQQARREAHERYDGEPPASDEPARKMTTASEIREQDAWIRGERDEPARTPDLMAALRVSVEAAKKRRIAPKDES